MVALGCWGGSTLGAAVLPEPSAGPGCPLLMRHLSGMGIKNEEETGSILGAELGISSWWQSFPGMEGLRGGGCTREECPGRVVHGKGCSWEGMSMGGYAEAGMPMGKAEGMFLGRDDPGKGMPVGKDVPGMGVPRTG